MHIHVIPGPQRATAIHHGDDCVVAVLRAAEGRVVRLAHSLDQARSHAAAMGLEADVECWDNLCGTERRVACLCQAADASGPCPDALRSGSRHSCAA